MTKTKLQADNINGVYEVSDFEGAVLSQDDFYASLKTNSDESVICAEVDDEMLAKISADYGVH